MGTKPQGSYDHDCEKIHDDYYRITWAVDRQAAGCRYRTPVYYTRRVDTEAAERFCRKWNIPWTDVD